MRIAITVKTNLTYDGRVLAQLYTLANFYPDTIIRIFVLEDGSFKGYLPDNVSYVKVNLITRKLPKTKSFQVLKLLEYGIRIFFKLFFFKPDIIHVHDEGATFGPVLYKYLFRQNFLIYDDHELLHLDNSIFLYQKMMKRLELKAFKLADHVIMANYERMKYSKAHIPILNKKPITIIENYHFIKEKSNKKNPILLKKVVGIKYLLHQGLINQERGQNLFYDILKELPNDWKLVMIGVKIEEYNQIIDPVKNLKYKTIFGGYISYDVLDKFWGQVNAAIIFYETNTINTKFCAPNRLYLAANLGIPVIVNDNPVLKKFVNKYKAGVVLNNEDNVLMKFFVNYNKFQTNAIKLKGRFDYSVQGKKLIDLYDNILSNTSLKNGY